MKARVVPALRGAQWLLEGVRLFLSAPLGWLMISFGYLLLVVLVSAIPKIGAPLVLLLYPGFTAGFLIASRSSAMRQPVELPMLISGFRERAAQQFALGGAYIGGIGLALLGSWLADDGALLRMLQGGPDAAQRQRDAQEVGRGALAAMLLYLPTFMMIFYAPVLTAWHGTRPAKSLFFSFVACLLNWRAFLLYVGIGILLMVVLINIIIIVALSMAGAEARANPAGLVPVLAPALLLFTLPVMMTSAYASYRDVFGAREGA